MPDGYVDVGWNDRTLTVAGLIALLQSLPDQQAPVMTEGCDCVGYVTHIRASDVGEERRPAVLLCRPGDPTWYKSREEEKPLLAGIVDGDPDE